MAGRPGRREKNTPAGATERPAYSVPAVVNPSRPPYGPDQADDYLDLVAAGHHPYAVCKMKGMPSERTIRQWRRDDKKFGEGFDNALKAGALFLLGAHRETIYDGTISPSEKSTRLKGLEFQIEKLDPGRFGAKVDPGVTAAPPTFNIVCDGKVVVQYAGGSGG